MKKTSARHQRLISTTRRHARLQLLRERQTRGGLVSGKRTLANNFPLELVADPKETSPQDDPDEWEWKLQITRRLLREYTTDSTRLALVEGRLLEGKPIHELAESLGIRLGTARCIIHRALRFLGIVK